jgi:hypothetical protein
MEGKFWGWSDEIKSLMEDFQFSALEIRKLTSDVLAVSKPGDSDIVKYERAWNKFHDLVISR